MDLPRHFYSNPYNVMIIPAFSIARSVLDPHRCSSFERCVRSYVRSSSSPLA